MPNWCVGTLKVRGEQENLRNFLLGTFVTNSSVVDVLSGTEVPKQQVEEDDYIFIRAGKVRVLYVKGSHRNFVDQDIKWYKDEDVLLIDGYQGAWTIDTEALTSLSREYQVDIKIYAFERGMEFNIDFEVHKGNVIKNDEITFDNYQWECVCSNLGG